MVSTLIQLKIGIHYFLYVTIISMLQAEELKIETSPLRGKEEDNHIYSTMIPAREVKLGEFPFLAMVMRQTVGPPLCCASIVSSNVVVMAHHCLGRVEDPEAYLVLAGVVNTEDRQNVQWRNVIHISVYKNLMALLKVTIPFSLDSRSTDIVHVTAKPLITNQLCYLVGWGNPNGAFENNIIQKTIDVIAVNQDQCSASENMVCVQSHDNHSEACLKDPGSQVICNGALFGAVKQAANDVDCLMKNSSDVNIVMVEAWFKNYTDTDMVDSTVFTWQRPLSAGVTMHPHNQLHEHRMQVVLSLAAWTVIVYILT